MATRNDDEAYELESQPPNRTVHLCPPSPGRDTLQLVSYSMRLRPVEPLPPWQTLLGFPWPSASVSSALTMPTSDFLRWCDSEERPGSIGNIKLLDILWLESRQMPFYHQYTVLKVRVPRERDSVFYFLRIDRLGILNSATAKEAVTISNLFTTDNILHDELARALNARIILAFSLKPDMVEDDGITLREVARCIRTISACSPQYKLQTTNCHFQARSLILCIVMKSPDSWMSTRRPDVVASHCQPPIADVILGPLLYGATLYYHHAAKAIIDLVWAFLIVLVVFVSSIMLMFIDLTANTISGVLSVISALALSYFLIMASINSIHEDMASLTNRMWVELELPPIRVPLSEVLNVASVTVNSPRQFYSKFNLAAVYFLRLMPVILSLSALDVSANGVAITIDQTDSKWYWWIPNSPIEHRFTTDDVVVTSIIWFQLEDRKLVILVVKERDSLQRHQILVDFQKKHEQEKATVEPSSWQTLLLVNAYRLFPWVLQIHSKDSHHVPLSQVCRILGAINQCYDPTLDRRIDPLAMFMLTLLIGQPRSWQFNSQRREFRPDILAAKKIQRFIFDDWAFSRSLGLLAMILLIGLTLGVCFSAERITRRDIVLAVILGTTGLLCGAAGVVDHARMKRSFRMLGKKVWRHIGEENVWDAFQRDYDGSVRAELKLVPSLPKTFSVVHIMPD